MIVIFLQLLRSTNAKSNPGRSSGSTPFGLEEGIVTIIMILLLLMSQYCPKRRY